MRLEVGWRLGGRDDGLRERRGALAAALERLVQLGRHARRPRARAA